MYQKQNMTFTLQIYTKPFLVKTLANSVLLILFFTLIHDLKKKKILCQLTDRNSNKTAIILVYVCLNIGCRNSGEDKSVKRRT